MYKNNKTSILKQNSWICPVILTQKENKLEKAKKVSDVLQGSL